MMNELFNLPGFLELFIATIQCCTSGILVAKTQSDDPDIASFYVIMVVLTLTPCILCWCGTKLMSQNERLLQAGYGSGWQQAPPRLRKYLVPLMQAANQPLTLSLSHKFTVNFELYSSIIQTSYSLFTIMKTVE